MTRIELALHIRAQGHSLLPTHLASLTIVGLTMQCPGRQTYLTSFLTGPCLKLGCEAQPTLEVSAAQSVLLSCLCDYLSRLSRACQQFRSLDHHQSQPRVPKGHSLPPMRFVIIDTPPQLIYKLFQPQDDPPCEQAHVKSFLRAAYETRTRFLTLARSRDTHIPMPHTAKTFASPGDGRHP